MPIYDYLCSNCGQTTEVIHGIDAPGPRYCPACGAEGTLRKTFATPTVHFKGSGWAKKDRSSSSGARAKSGPAASSSTEGGDGASKRSGEGSGEGSGTGSGSSTGGTDSAEAKKSSGTSED
jgi:putative FmdB family regulatory protein